MLPPCLKTYNSFPTDFQVMFKAMTLPDQHSPTSSPSSPRATSAPRGLDISNFGIAEYLCHATFSLHLSHISDDTCWGLIVIALDSQFNLDRMDIFIILSFIIHKYGISFHLFRLLISLNNIIFIYTIYLSLEFFLGVEVLFF